MDLDTFIVAVFCAIDEELGELAERERWRTRGPRPRLADSEVLTMEVVGEYLGIDTDRGLYALHGGKMLYALRQRARWPGAVWPNPRASGRAATRAVGKRFRV